MSFKEFLLESDSKRQSLVKIQQMSGKKFVEFLGKLKPYVKRGKFDFTELNVSEKVDGQAFRIAVKDGDIFVESSHSGMISNPNDFTGPFMIPFKEVLKHLQSKKKKLLEIYEKHGNFKVLGELLYTKDAGIDKDGSITIVATKYKADLLGKVATLVMFDEMNFVGEQFLKSGGTQVRDSLKKISDKDFQFVDTNKIKWQGEGVLEYNISSDVIEDIMSNPKQLLDNRVLLKDIQSQFVDAFENVVRSRGSVFGLSSSVVEGIVLDIPDFGMVGASNSDWKKLKSVIFRHLDTLESLKKEFFKNVTGFSLKRKVLEVIDNDSKEVDKRMNKYKKQFKKDLVSLKLLFEKEKDSLPKNVVKSQEKAFISNIKKLSSINKPKDIVLFLNHKL